MRRLKLSRWVAVLTLAIALAPRTTPAQTADTLSISGTFHMDELWGTVVGADLAEVFARDNEHWWSFTLYGVTYSHDTFYYEDLEGAHDEQFITRVHATSFDFAFFGPDADVLNEVVSQQLIRGGVGDGDFLELRNGDYFDPVDFLGGGRYGAWDLGLLSLDGVSFSAGDGWLSPFSTDENGYPVVEPQRVTSERTFITDLRSGSSGSLVSFVDVVDIGSAGPPPLLPTLSIQDGSVLEGNKGTSRLVLTVTLSRNSHDVVTVDYQTADGTALATKDYSSTRGTLTFLPGQTSRTISISIITDRKRELNETFSVKLSNAVGATIDDAVAMATILNDD